jgi:hypothetical protein
VNEERRIWAVQFHPEVHHTPLGAQLIRNFVFNILRRALETGRRRILFRQPLKGFAPRWAKGT